MAVTQDWSTAVGATPPTGWNFAFEVVSTVNAKANNAITDSANAGGTAYSTANDTFSGIVAASHSCFISAINTGYVFIGARLSGTITQYGMQGNSSVSGYSLEFSSASGVYSLIFHKMVAGTLTTVGSPLTVTSANLPYGVRYTITLVLTGTSTTTLAAKIMRESDGKYWDGSAWQTSSATTAFTATDSSSPITGAGKYGVEVNCAAAGNVTSDDFSIDTAVAVATAYNFIGPTTGPVGVNSTAFTLTPNAALSGSDTVNLADASDGTFKASDGTTTITSLSFSSGATAAQTFYYIPGSSGAKTITPTSATLSLPASPTTKTYTAFTKTNANATNINYSPFNWFSTGSGVNAYAATLHAGAWIQFTVSGTTAVDVLMDESGAATGAQMVYFVDDGAETIVNSTTTGFTIAMSSASHKVTIFVDWTNAITGVWATPANAFAKITGFNLNGGTLAATTLPTDTLLVIGDSISWAEFITARTGGARSWTTYVHNLAKGLNAQLGVVGWPGQGLDKAATATDVPQVFKPSDDTNSAWNKHWAGVSRLSGGLLSPAPTYIVINHGTNATGSATTTAALTGLLTALRLAAPSAKIFDVIPFNGAQRTALQTGFTNYGTDTSAFQIDLVLDAGTVNAYNVVSRYITEQAPHPNAIGHSRAAAALVGAIKGLLSTTTTVNGNTFNSGGLIR